MKVSLKILMLFILSLGVISEAGADTVYLKNGRHMKGIIQQETNEYLELGVGSGVVKFYRQEIERVERSSQDENLLVKGSWDRERLRKEEELNPKDAEVIREGDHLLVNALLNKKINARLLVDTGASLVVLSPAIAKKLGINTGKKGAPQIKVKLADGKEIQAAYLKLDSISIGEAEAEGVDASVIFEEDAFTHYDGILGMSFLKLFNFGINLDETKLDLQKK